MAYSTIPKPSVHFNTKLYTGNGGTQSITGVGFQPDWVWCKSRNDANDHNLFDAVRGVTKWIESNNSNAQQTSSNTLTSFNSDGFSVGDHGEINGNGDTQVSWCWKAGGGQGSSNTDGSINTTYTSVNTTAGFSISQYTATGNNATVGHGLGVAPKMILFKNLNRTSGNAQSWGVYHQALGNTKFLQLDTTGAENQTSPTSLFFNNTSPTSSVFSIGTNNRVNADAGDTYIAYCFAEKAGYSKFGSYTGNGNADGPFVYTGFKPAFFITKRTDTTAGWQMYDSVRDVDNPADHRLQAQDNAVELVGDANTDIDFLSNGFKMRAADSDSNANGGTYIYMAFAANPLVANSGTDGVPATAR